MTSQGPLQGWHSVVHALKSMICIEKNYILSVCEESKHKYSRGNNKYLQCTKLKLLP